MELKNKIAEVEKGWAAKEQAIRESVDMVLRREWELKARLEIDRLVKGEIEQLRRRFDAEVHARVQEELQKKAEAQEFVNSLPDAGFPHSSIGASTDCDFPSTTDITEFESPEPMVLKKSTRTPFGRAQTMFERVAGTPMDIEMASPSPIAIASLYHLDAITLLSPPHCTSQTYSMARAGATVSSLTFTTTRIVVTCSTLTTSTRI